ncbi:MAG: pitrilysin family protein [Candidatus Elarobacter sp.]
MNDSVATLPAAGPPRDASLPSPVERVLDNGLRVVAFSQRNLPLIAAQLVVRCGGAAEHEDEAGLAALVAALLTQGTTGRSAVELAATSDALGARLDAGSGYDATVIGVSATTPAFPHAFALLDEVVREPAFTPREVERVRTKSISDLALTYANPSAVARLVAQRVAYGASPYGHPLAGTAATLAALGRDRVAWFHERFYRPDDAVLVIGGDLTVDDAFALAQREFGDWRAPQTPMDDRPHGAFPPPRARVVVVDKADAGRTALIAGRVTIARRSPDYYAAVVAAAVLNGYSGRLNQAIRVQRGLSYGAGASLSPRRMPGLFIASTLVDHARAVEATQVTMQTIRSLADAPATEEELATRKATVTGGFYRSVETIDGIAGALAEHVLYDVPLDELQRYAPSVQAIAAKTVCDFAVRGLVDDDFIVLVGDAARFADELGRTYGDVQTIRSLADAPATEEELATRKATVTGGFYRSVETFDGIAGAIAEHVLYDVPLDELQRYAPSVQAIAAKTVCDFAVRGLVDDDFIVLVGDASRFADELGRTYRDVQTISGDALELGSPSLER